MGNRSPHKFFLLLFGLSVPFWLIGAVTDWRLFSGLPVAAIGCVCPGASALLLLYRQDGSAGVIALLKRSFDAERIGSVGWYMPILLLLPGTMALSYLAKRWLGSLPTVPAVSLPAVPVFFVVFFIAALSEEIGWSGYVIDPLQERGGALSAGLVVGMVWAIWHFVPLVQAHRSPEWIAWWSLGTVAFRVLIVWLYNNTGRSIFAATLLHAMSNLCTLTVSAYYDPHVFSPILAFEAALVIIVWGPRTLASLKWRRD